MCVRVRVSVCKSGDRECESVSVCVGVAHTKTKHNTSRYGVAELTSSPDNCSKLPESHPTLPLSRALASTQTY